MHIPRLPALVAAVMASTTIVIGQAQPATVTGHVSIAGKVIYRPQPIPGLPAGVKINGPESIAPVLAIVPADRKAMLFAGKEQSASLTTAEPSLKTATTYQVGLVVRQDWQGPNGPRRGTDVESCLAPAG